MRMYDIIEKKRDGKELSYEEIDFFVNNYCSDEIKDYQVSALLMAIFLNGMNSVETANLTKIMADSGDKIDLSSIHGTKVDKHSTGGVGDKTTLIIAPIVAALGVPIAKMSGRALGHTGGTIDKLESIPGFRTSVSVDEFVKNVKEIGISIVSQTGNLVPADKKIYALRDVTATVNNIPLIASSVMSKKIASGADKILLDIKCGNGAFMGNKKDALLLAKTMVDIGESLGRRTVAAITDMNVPLGNCIGNSIEIIESIEILKGKGAEDLKKVSFFLAAKMLELAKEEDFNICYEKVLEVVASGKSLKKFEDFLKMQGGNTEIIYNYDLFERAKIEYNFVSWCDGFVEKMQTDNIGKASMVLGAGRKNKESKIDYSAGIMLCKKPGERLKKGETIAKLFTNDETALVEAQEILKESIKISVNSPSLKPLILGVVDINGMQGFWE